MDVFKFKNPLHPTRLDQGELINNLKSKLWIERYRDVGEFELVADVETKMHKTLPIGTLISHINSTEIMVVENHEINETGAQTDIKITGRSFDSVYENRIVGSNQAWPTTASATLEYLLLANYTWNQAVFLLKDHTDSAVVIDPNDALLYVTVMTDITGSGVSELRSIKRGNLYTRLSELLAIDNLGIKTIRPGPRSPFSWSNQDIAVVIHKGQDLSKEVAFSYTTGEIQSADYLWSNKRVKNAALVTGRWLETVVKDASVGYNRRMMHVDATEIDNVYTVAPTGIDRTNALAAMTVIGQSALLSQKNVALIKAEPTRDSKVYKYREHYEVGDIITVAGEYSETTTMRISEYVEIEDENGESGHPTLSAI